MPRFCLRARQPISTLFPALLLSLLCGCVLCSCSSRLETNPARMGKVETAQPAGVTALVADAGGDGDMATMEVVSNGCLKAWRMACRGDEKGSLAVLEDLDKHYPGVLSIQRMEGQVYEHFGRNDLAVVHYRKALNGNEFSSFHAFKLAEAMRKNGDYKGAEDYYRKILAKTPQFGAAALGLAKCLLVADKQSGEARNLLSQAATDPLVSKEAQTLLDKLEPGAKAGN